MSAKALRVRDPQHGPAIAPELLARLVEEHQRVLDADQDAIAERIGRERARPLSVAAVGVTVAPE